MSTIYFTTTANTGNGSLRKAIADAAPGDVVEPDPTVFGAGELVAITTSSYLTVTKSLSLRAGKSRVRLLQTNPQTTSAIVLTNDADYFNLTDFDVVGRLTLSGCEENTLTRCRVYGNAVKTHGVYTQTGKTIVMNDCLVTGWLGRGFHNGANGSTTINRSTIAGNVQPIFNGSGTTYSATDSIVDPVCSRVGFVAPPPDALDDSAALPWEDWDLRLTPTSPYATGATSAADEYDAEGVARGRDVEGSTVYAQGAYELVVADYYQASASSESFNDPNDWTTDPTRTTPPESITSGVFYLDENAVWRDAPPEGSTLIVAGRRVETFGADLALARLESGRDSTLVFSGEDRVVRANDARLGTGTTLAASPGSSGYLAVPAGVDVSGATRVGVAVSGLGAGLTSFSAASQRPGRATLSWTAQDGSETVRLERREGAGSWVEVAAAVPGSSGFYEAATPNGRATFRAFDGEVFWTDDAWSSVGVQFRVAAIAVPGERVAQLWKAATTVVATSESVRVGQGVSILAQIVDAFDESALLLADGSNVQSVSYTCYYVSNGLFDETFTPVAGHENVVVNNDCVLEAPQTSDAWTRDEIGYTFALTPDVRTAPLFEKPGEYQIKVVVRLTEGNPVTFYVPISVEES